MNYNIALSSFVYILIFIFPGVLFRKFYYNGPFTKQFNSGNLFERFIITLFLSVISLTSSGAIILLLRDVFNIPFLPSISYKTVYDILNNLKDNELPNPKVFSDTYKDFTILLLLLFSLSAFLGSFCYLIITSLKLDLFLNVFKFNDKWHYHVKGKNDSQNRTKKYLYTEINVLVQDGNSEKTMYSGYLNDYTVDENNSIKSVLLEETHRYNYNDLNNADVNRNRPIRGSLMYIACDNVLNINFTHIFLPRISKTLREKSVVFLKVLFFILYAFTFLLFWIDDMFWDFKELWKKPIFIISSLLIELLLFNALKESLLIKKMWKNRLLVYTELIVLCSGLLIFSLDLINIWIIIIAEVLTTIIFFLIVDKIIEKQKSRRSPNNLN